ncbi:uncharacterized protein CIMG_11477 [Coccidioides immitis RS]|uniref:Uncharacterized protein n=1 Tax=Coccidioides immitis (strain RS) TaxID=246410 RepID=A0A0D8JUY6_COCIM|nr:uncharacterized protein CIMG_11477 [Coccidioides immitis RS]KJF61102.1 hypothetical protein CIMG_11477 [Coccidioides immitis RS]
MLFSMEPKCSHHPLSFASLWKIKNKTLIPCPRFPSSSPSFNRVASLLLLGSIECPKIVDFNNGHFEINVVSSYISVFFIRTVLQPARE